LERTSSITSVATTTAAPPPSIRNRSRGHTHSSSAGGRPSIQSSVRSSFDNMGASSRHRMPGDKAQIMDWQPPSQSMMASQLMEVDQLRSLQTYVDNVEAELESHNELKHGIELAVSYCPMLLHSVTNHTNFICSTLSVAPTTTRQCPTGSASPSTCYARSSSSEPTLNL
jgi:hypothetical protein